MNKVKTAFCVIVAVFTVMITNITAYADDCYEYDEATRVLTLKNDIIADSVKRFDQKSNVVEIRFDSSAKLPDDCSSLFAGYSSCEKISFSSIDTSNVTNMKNMFRGCEGFKTLDLDGLDTSNVTDMSYMFYDCKNIKTLDLSGFDTGNVTNMRYMFYSCIGLQSINLSGINTGNVTNMGSMFYYCSKLKELDLSGFDTSKTTRMSYMFYNCSALERIDMSGFDTSSVTSMSNMFYGCCGLETLDLSGFDTTDTIINSMFAGVNNLETLILGEKFTALVEECEFPLGAGWGLVVNGEIIERFTEGEYLVLTNSGKNTYVNLFDPQSVSFDKETGILTLKGNVIKDEVVHYANNRNVKKVIAEEETVLPADCSSLFANFMCSSIDLSNADTSAVTDMSYMFSMCNMLEDIDLNGIDTGNVTTMSHMFTYCLKMTAEFDLGKWDLKNVTDMSYMFENCQKITNFGLDDLNTVKLKTISGMFTGCRGINTISLGGFDTSSLEDISYLLSVCMGLTNVDLRDFDTSGVKNMNNMFYRCTGIETLDLSNFDTNSANSLENMFLYDDLDTLILGENFKNLPANAALSMNNGWAKVVDGVTKEEYTDTGYLELTNDGCNTYRRLYDLTFNCNKTDEENLIEKHLLGDIITVPEIWFDAPSDLEFGCWKIGDKEYQPNDTFTLNGDTTIDVFWQPIGGYPVTVRFDPNGGSGTMEDKSAKKGDYTLPKCTYTAPYDKIFYKWSVDGKEYSEEEVITITKDTTVKALWEDLFKIIEQPKDALVDRYEGQVEYSCRARNIDTYEWYIIDEDNTMLGVNECKKKGLITGYRRKRTDEGPNSEYTVTVTLTGVDASLEGKKICCVFTYDDKNITSDAVTINFAKYIPTLRFNVENFKNAAVGHKTGEIKNAVVTNNTHVSVADIKWYLRDGENTTLLDDDNVFEKWRSYEIHIKPELETGYEYYETPKAYINGYWITGELNDDGYFVFDYSYYTNSRLKGDIDGDKEVTDNDAALLLKYIVGETDVLDEFQVKVAQAIDYWQKTVPDMTDVIWILENKTA